MILVAMIRIQLQLRECRLPCRGVAAGCGRCDRGPVHDQGMSLPSQHLHVLDALDKAWLNALGMRPALTLLEA